MKKIIYLVGLPFLISCSGIQSKNENKTQKIENQIKEIVIYKVKSHLKDASSYKPGGFRFETYMPNSNNTEYPYLVDSVYMSNCIIEIIKNDTSFCGSFTVYHIYKATNSFGAYVTEMTRACFDTHLNLKFIDNWSSKQEGKTIALWNKKGVKVEPLSFESIEQ